MNTGSAVEKLASVQEAWPSPAITRADITNPQDREHTFGTIKFNGSASNEQRESRYVVIKRRDWEAENDGNELLNLVSRKWGWGLKDRPKLIISLMGGAMSFGVDHQLTEDLKRCLVRVATNKGINAWIISYGTHRGMSKVTGDAFRDEYKRLQLEHVAEHCKPVILGIALFDNLLNHNELVQKTKPDEDVVFTLDTKNVRMKDYSNLLDSHHSNFILIEDPVANEQNEFGAELKIRRLFTCALLKEGGENMKVPVVTLILEGGCGTVKTALEAVRAGTPIIVFAGTGRAADLIAEVYRRVKAKPKIVNRESKFKDLIPMANLIYPEDDVSKNPLIGKRSIDEIREMLTKDYWHLVNIYTHEADKSVTIDEEIMNAVIKAGKAERKLPLEEWHRCLELAISWDLCDVVRTKLLDSHNRSNAKTLSGQELCQKLFRVLMENKHRFVQLFIELEVDLETFFRTKSLQDIYNETLKDSDKCGRIGAHLQALNQDAINGKGNTTTGFTLDYDLKKLDVDIYVPDFNYEFVLKKLTPDMYTPDESKEVLDRHWQELFVWAVLFNRIEMAAIFWKKCPDPICAALFANRVLKALAERAGKLQEFDLRRELENNAMEFESVAVAAMNACYRLKPDDSYDLLQRKVKSWGQRTLLSTAYICKQMDFMGTDCCQELTSKIWRGRIRPGSFWHLRLFSALICPLLVLIPSFLYIDTTSTDEQERHRQCCKNAQYCRRLYRFFTAPMVKFCYHTMSYAVLLGLYSYFVMIDLLPGQGPGVPEILVLVWTITLLFELIRQLFILEESVSLEKLKFWTCSKRILYVLHVTEQKLKFFFVDDGWNFMKLIMYLLTIIGFILARSGNADYSDSTRNVYSVAVIMHFLCVLQLYFIDKSIGPKVVIFIHEVRDVVVFLFLLFVFVFAFGVVERALLYPNGVPSWWTLLQVVYVPYNTIYQQYIPFTTLMGQVGGCTNNYSVYSTDLSVPQCSKYSWLINVIYAVYILVTVIMLLNILIAVFNNTFNSVNEQNEKTWGYHRYSLTMEYCHKSLLPPPLILLSQIYWIIRTCKPREKSVASDEGLVWLERVGADSCLSDPSKIKLIGKNGTVRDSNEGVLIQTWLESGFTSF